MAGCQSCRLLLLCAYVVLSVIHIEATPLPHVDDCYLCHKCHTGKPPGRHLLARMLGAAEPLWDLSAGADTSSGSAGIDSSASSSEASDTGRSLLAKSKKPAKKEEQMYVPPGFKFNIMPMKDEIAAKSLKPNCTECYGCDTQIQPLQAAAATNQLGQNMKIEVGASPEWLFFADLPETANTGRKAVLKVWCMPIDKVHGTFSWRCSNTAEGAKAVQFLLAQQKVMEECGLLDVTIKVWPGRVNAVVPKHGLHVWWDGLWMEKAEGVSLNQLSYKRQRNFVAESLTTMLGPRLNRSRVVRAAIYDLLSSQCDRHAQNVFITEQGEVKLIDNLQALQFSWVNCAVDSIFLPGTQKNMIIRWGGNIVGKARGAKPRRSVNPMVVLDYRCYTPGGQLGTNYDPQLKECLKKLSGMSAKQIQLEYGFPYEWSANVLQMRASDLYNKGFEWTLRYGKPRSFKPKSYRQQPPCCNLTVPNPKSSVIQCGHDWQDHIETPFGDPMGGGEWRRPYPDPGTYEGGTFVDEPFE
ncbi:hypothetical protein CHLRE_16g672049v5 [Chlamydomonas reinhardtii]|uniref:PI3K/PI4K catalytic domain-containing protein n=1 Tax=Chlamydomonas reinhardtii TaxID=3055 RepID=A8J3D6_CHLRE|nr:uncharacterized protein CHLRE_16g672049v5 [Chlamydomonas reinhardtii]PNW72358.1 hypothetical protein CHLRE_16g672049v5 [Chlamydomonas reinhardtii]|eukprot:XP_001695907.1 predicted protein [Chlamydomonas reinhardtii]